ncbi:hypothetical protein [Streptomyces silvensis]|uniref:hypothetical protein n=1 Tax=Streptomyces silvensis TaxID=1765722 RepID=UPI000A732858|nr:hypothetical protein [Streptomyces silvensis]
MIPAALAVVLAAVEAAQREHVTQPAAVVARIAVDLRNHGWTLAPLDQPEQPRLKRPAA